MLAFLPSNNVNAKIQQSAMMVKCFPELSFVSVKSDWTSNIRWRWRCSTAFCLIALNTLLHSLNDSWAQIAFLNELLSTFSASSSRLGKAARKRKKKCTTISFREHWSILVGWMYSLSLYSRFYGHSLLFLTWRWQWEWIVYGSWPLLFGVGVGGNCFT